MGESFDLILIILFLGGLLSDSVSFDISFDGIEFINVPGNRWEGNLSSGNAGNESGGSEFHILKNWFKLN
jgi:hypothetical protein